MMKIIRREVSQLPEILDNQDIYIKLNSSDKTQDEIITSGHTFSSKEYVDQQVNDSMETFSEELDAKASKGELANKQNKLTAGVGIEISGDTISATFDSSIVKLVEELPSISEADSNKIYVVIDQSNARANTYNEYIFISETQQWVKIGEVTTEVDLSEYIKTVDADKRYLTLKNGTGTITINGNNGQMSNYGPNGQAFSAVRNVSGTSLTGKYINAASFGVKLDGTAAFSHKTYNTYDIASGLYSGARNTAVMTFSGPTGLRYAKNTSSTATDVTEDMYKYVGVIDSPDEKQKVYSAKQVDDIISGLTAQIEALEQRIQQLENN